MREEFEKLPKILNILNKKVFEYSEFADRYNFIDAMVCINARPSQHKDHGLLNGAWYAYQEQQKKIDKVKKYIFDFMDDSEFSSDIQELLK